MFSLSTLTKYTEKFEYMATFLNEKRPHVFIRCEIQMMPFVLTSRTQKAKIIMKGVDDMATTTIRLDEGVREETTRIASEMGLTFNAVMNIMARKFNAEKGFPFPVKLETAQKTVFDMSSDEFEIACQNAVAQREDVSTMDYVTRFDKESGLISKVYADGRVEYVLS